MRVVGLYPALLDGARPRRQREQTLGRFVHQRGGAGGVRDDDRIGDRIDDQVQAVAFGARQGFGDAHLPVVLFDLLAGATQVGHVAQNRDHAAALPRIFSDGTEQLEDEVRAVDRIHQQQLAPGRAGLLDRLARQRGREQHVVHAHRATPPLALFLRSREQRQRARIGDQQPALGISEQNGVRHSVDDVVQQRALAPLLAVAIGQRLVSQQLVDFLAEDVGKPVQLGR